MSLAIAVGALGFHPLDFYRMTPQEFFCAVRGYKEKVRDEREAMALQTFYMVVPHLKRKPSFEKFKESFLGKKKPIAVEVKEHDAEGKQKAREALRELSGGKKKSAKDTRKDLIEYLKERRRGG